MITVLDDVIADPEGYRAAALLCDFHDIPAGPITFHGMAPVGWTPLTDVLEARGLTPTFSAFRLSPRGQEEPNFIHTDRDMGDWTAILYLNPNPPDADGTTFWRERATGATDSTTDGDDQLAEWLRWRRPELWESWCTVPAAFNRMVLFSSPLFHSRAIHENWGDGQDARLIQVTFGTGVLACV